MSQDGYDYQHSWYPSEPQQQAYPAGDGTEQQPWQWTGQPEQSHPEQALYAEQQPHPEVYAEQQSYPEQALYPEQQSYQQTESAYPPEIYAAITESIPQVPDVPAESPTAPPADLDGEEGPETAGTTPETEPAAPGRSRRAPNGGTGSAADRAKAALGGLLAKDGGSDRRTLVIRAGAGVLALGVLVTAGVVVMSGGSGHHTPAAPPPSSDTGFAVAHNKIWTAQPAGAPQQGSDDTLVGSWLLANALVRADSTGVHAYDAASGKASWSLDAPAQGAVPCGLSPTVNSSGLGGVLFRTGADPKSPCTLLAAVDTKTGKAAWTKQLSNTTNPYAAHVAVFDDKVIAVGDDKVSAWAAGDGHDLWQYAGQGKYCTLSGSANGNTVLVHSSCADSNPGDQMVAVGAADGKTLWSHGLDGQPKTVTVLSAEPAAVLTTGDQPTDDKLISYGQDGNPTATVPLASNTGRLNATTGTFDPTPAVFFQDHLAVATSTGTDGKTSVVAYDLASGKEAWHTAVSEKGNVRAVGLDNGTLVLATEERVEQPAHLSRFALNGGQETVGGNFPPATGSLLTSGRVLIGSDRVVVIPEHSSNFGIATAFQAAKG
ncbi:PQQ-binding-like beta-propeller repeat protein [Kitasatospora sp. RB6PN24]|uniref:outer membrane protein assembly factor BamB family protein n=1 Tax=Kitasatospora humi TaxID=2893891 RepID=UPI001E5981ED|nr:PQQ-binding-like beta-propeller repeat protein [Kitasatospora humi]MCC9312394.1 PQQ-binding-like beta-propeller repeat protein [Kitasatospora humi]